ncbi:MAG: hypothetical protein K6T86_09430 [Pirellulales bacterium]|nr:hypothetical protein [Pirellulales bacterium]
MGTREVWTTRRVKHTSKGPVVWHAKHALLYVPDDPGLPDRPSLVCTHALTGEVKYFLSNAPVETPVGAMLRMGFSRWRIECCFEDGKSALGLWEGRRWLGLKRHWILTTVSYLFLAETCQRLRKKNREWTVCQVRYATDALLRGLQLDPQQRQGLFQRVDRRIAY